MSHPMYNPYKSGEKTSSQGQYGQMDPQRAPPHLGLAWSFNPSGSASVILGNSGGTLPVSNRSETNWEMGHNLMRSTDFHTNQASKDVKYQNLGQGTWFTNTKRDGLLHSSTGSASFLTSAASQENQCSNVGSSSLNLSLYKRTTEDNNSKLYSASSFDNQGSGEGRFNTSKEGQCDMQSILGSGDPETDKLAPSTDSSPPRYTSESALKVLLHLGLEKEDLEHLASYPEDQITPSNLPFILRQIRIDKAKKTATTETCYKPQPSTSMSGMDKPAATRGGAICQDKLTVVDYGHTGRYTSRAGVKGERTVGNSTIKCSGNGNMLLDTYNSGGHSRDALQRSMTEVKSNALASPRAQISSATSFSSFHSSVASPTKQLQAQPNKSSQSILNTVSLSKKDMELRNITSHVSRPILLKQSKPNHQLSSKTLPACTLLRGVNPGRPGLVLMGSSDGQSKIQGKAPNVAEQIENQQNQQQQRQPQHQQQRQMDQQLKQPLLQIGQPLLLRTFSAVEPVPPVSPAIAAVPPAPRQPVPSLTIYTPHMLLPPSSQPFPVKGGAFKGLPTRVMMQDYAAATPRTFPHTCCLCNKECTSIKDWLSHQNTSSHLENCTLLRTTYPEWDGQIPPLSSPTSNQTSQSHYQKTKHESHSHSHSPPHPRGSKDGWEKRGSRSRSRSPRHHYGSEGKREKHTSRCRSRSPHYQSGSGRSREKRNRCSHSRSPNHLYGSESRRDKRGSPSRMSHGSKYNHRSRSRSLSPCYGSSTSSQYQSSSWNYERQSSPRWRAEKQEASPSRSQERQSSSSRSDDKWTSTTRNRERQSSTERSMPQRRKSTCAERLAKKLLKASAVQSLSKQSDLVKAMVKSLAPALVAEMAKMKSLPSSSTSSSSSSSSKAAKASSSTKAKLSLLKCRTSSSSKLKPTKSSHPTVVKLRSLSGFLSYNDVIAAVEKFGKTKSVVMHKSKPEAIVRFENMEDTKKLKRTKILDINGTPVSVIRVKATGSSKPPETPTKKQGQHPQQKSRQSSGSTGQTTEFASPVKVKTTLTSPSGSRKLAKGKLVTKAKVLVSKAKNVSTKQPIKTVKTSKVGGKVAVKSVKVKKEASALSKYKESDVPEKGRVTGDSKQKPRLIKLKGGTKEKVVTSKEMAMVHKHSKMHICVPVKGKKRVTKAKVVVSKAETSAKRTPKTQAENLVGDVKEEMMEVAVAKANNVLLQPEVSENLPDASGMQAQKSVLAPGDTVMDAEVKAATDSEMKPQPEPVKVETEELKVTEQMEVAETAKEELMEVKSSFEAGGQQVMDTKTLLSKPSESHLQTSKEKTTPSVPSVGLPQTPQTAFKIHSNMINATSQVQQTVKPEEPEKTTNALQRQQKPEGNSNADALEEEQKVTVETKAEQEDLATHELAASVKTEPTAEPSTRQQTVFTTAEEEMENQQKQDDISCVQMETTVSSKVQDDAKDDVSSDVFNDGFNLGDFVTVDEIVEDVEEKPADDGSSSSEKTSREKKEKQNSDLLSAAKKTLSSASKDSKRSAPSSPILSSSSQPTSGNWSSRSTSEVPKNQDNSSERTKPSSSVGVMKASVSSSPQSAQDSGQKAQPGKRKSPTVVAHKDTNTFPTAAAAVKTSVEKHQLCSEKAKPTKTAVAKSGHKESAESTAVKTATETPSEMNPPEQGRESELANQTKSRKTDWKDKTQERVKKSKDEGEHSKEKGDECKNVLDSLSNQTDELMDVDGKQESSNEAQTPGPEEGQRLVEGDHRVLDSVEGEGKACPEEGSEMETDAFIQERDISSKNQAAAADEDSRLVEDEGSTVKQTPKRDDSSSDKPVAEDAAQTITEGDNQELETLTEQISKTDVGPTEEETSRRSQSRTRTSKSKSKEKSSKKQNKTVKKYETRSRNRNNKNLVENTEEIVFEIVDSVEDDSVQKASTPKKSSRRTGRGIKEARTLTSSRKEEPDVEEETMYKILDSVEDEAAVEEPTMTRSTRGRRGGRTQENTSNEKTKKEQTPTRKRSTPARDSQERKVEKTQKTEEKAPLKESTPFKKNDTLRSEEEATYEVLDAVEEDENAAQEKPRRGRPKRAVKTAKKQQTAASRKVNLSTKVVDEEEDDEYQILDSVEDETVDGQTPTDKTKSVDEKKTKKRTYLSLNEDEEEPLYQIVDSLEDDQVQEEQMTTAASSVEENEGSQMEDKSSAKKDLPTCGSTSVEASEHEVLKKKPLLQLAMKAEEVAGDPSAEVSAKRIKVRTPKRDVQNENKQLTQSQRDAGASAETMRKSPLKSHSAAESALVNLDEVSEEEEDYTDDTAEEEELKKRQAVAEEREKEREERKTREKKDGGPRSRSSSRRRPRNTKERRRENEEVVEMDPQELVTLDEVGEDEAAEEGQGWESMEGELQELVTLDEIIDEEVDGKEPRPLSLDNQSAIRSETLTTLDEAGRDEDEKMCEEKSMKTSRSAKRKRDDDTDEEFVVPKFGFFCNLCSVFYLNESTSEETHCSSREHYDNLQSYYQKLRGKVSRTSP